jgi:GH18 family chitinase
MAKYNVFETKEDWAKFRRGLFTASEVHRLLAEPKLKADKEAGNLSEGAKTYVRERVAILLAPEEPQHYNSNMERGNEAEPQAVLAYAESIGKSVNDDDFVYTSVGGFVFFTDEDHNAGGTPDIIIGKSICEIKCPLSKTHLEYMMIDSAEELKKAVPQYYSQMQMNMWLCDAEDGVFISFDDRYYNSVHHLHSIHVPRDEEHIELIKSKLLRAKEYKDQILNTI